jgi:hypothetical protein
MPNVGEHTSEATQEATEETSGSDPSSQADVPEEVRAADTLVRKALDFTVELFPATSANVAYLHKEEASLPDEVPSSGSEDTGRFEDVRQVPAHPDFTRVVTIDVDERISRFLREDAEAHAEAHLQTAYARLKIPVILAHEWTRQVAGRTSAETREALGAQLPAHIIAHLIADQFAQATDSETHRFARHREPHSAHDRLATTIVESLGYMDVLARSRVEHQALSHGLVIAPLSEGSQESQEVKEPWPLSQSRYPADFRTLKRTSLLTDGYQSALCITPEGKPAKMITRDTLGDVRSMLDRDFGSLSFLAAAAKQHEGIGLMLRPGGSIMTFAGGQPLFVRRSGVWHGLVWNQIRSTMVARYGKVGAQVFGIVLILTTSGKGGILAIVEDGPDALNLPEKDRVDLARAKADAPTDTQSEHREGGRDKDAEWLLHRLLPAGNVLDLSRPTLALLAGIDGATIVDEDGRLLSYGAIVQSSQGQSEGARTAAARTLSAHGLVIKVSEDGPVQIFENGETVLTV